MAGLTDVSWQVGERILWSDVGDVGNGHGCAAAGPTRCQRSLFQRLFQRFLAVNRRRLEGGRQMRVEIIVSEIGEILVEVVEFDERSRKYCTSQRLHGNTASPMID